MLESNKTFKTFIGHLFKTTQKMQGTTRDSQYGILFALFFYVENQFN